MNFLYEIKQYLRELKSQRRCESMLPLDFSNQTNNKKLSSKLAFFHNKLITNIFSII